GPSLLLQTQKKNFAANCANLGKFNWLFGSTPKSWLVRLVFGPGRIDVFDTLNISPRINTLYRSEMPIVFSTAALSCGCCGSRIQPGNRSGSVRSVLLARCV